ncbi:MAG: hypothetical protein ACI8U3_002737 [Brevundimonas sp.]|jgi:hypothetical protein|uniref:hypothetical protein n=1 Tax=Brevundimonas sp. TaxID=1871086 RepID=UPI0039E5AE1E
MWNVIRTFIIALAFVGFLDQSMARAAPLPVAADAVEMSSDCAEMAMDQADPSDGKRMPCDEMTPECMVQMGCTAVSPVLRPESILSHPSVGAPAAYDRVVTRLTGTTPCPLRDPPRLQP